MLQDRDLNLYDKGRSPGRLVKAAMGIDWETRQPCS